MNLIIYTTHCLACTNKKLWRKVRSFANTHNLVIEERRVSKRPEWREEAQQSGVHMPYAVHNGVSLNLNEELERLL